MVIKITFILITGTGQTIKEANGDYAPTITELEKAGKCS